MKSIRYDDLKEIIFIDTDNTIELNYKDDKATDEEFQLDKTTYSEIRSYLKTNLKEVDLKNYSVLKQIAPQVIVLGLSVLISVMVYVSAVELENGGTLRTSGRNGLVKKLIAALAETLGTTGTLIVALWFLGFLPIFLLKKYKTPKRVRF